MSTPGGARGETTGAPIPGEQLVLVGAGPVGVAAARAAVEDGVAALVAVVDPDEGARRAAGPEVAGFESVARLPIGTGTVAMLTFSSRAEETARVIRTFLERGLHIVTTCEELAYPPLELRASLDHAARVAGRAVVVGGANPGFAMDRLPLLAARAGRRVRQVTVERVVDTSSRRAPLVAKSGRGLTPREFAAGVAAGLVGHVGLPESARLIAAGLGWEVVEERVTIDPVLDPDGLAAGQHQTAHLDTAAGVVHLDLVMAWGARAIDRVTVDGDHPLTIEIKGGYHGDWGTTARTVRLLEAVAKLEPGFYRPTDLPIWA